MKNIADRSPAADDERTAIEIAASHMPGDDGDGTLEGKVFLRLREAYWRGYRAGKRWRWRRWIVR